LLQTEQNGCVENKGSIVRESGGNGYKAPLPWRERGWGEGVIDQPAAC